MRTVDCSPARWRIISILALAALGVWAEGHRPADAKIDPDGAAKELIALTNLSRTSNGLPSLPADNRLNRIAGSRSEDMITRRYFSHAIPPDGKNVVDIIESLGIRFRAGSENIAWNNALDFTTVQLASGDFMNSLSHRANVLNGRWHRVGAGAAEGDGKKMYAVVFLELPGEEAVSPGSRTHQRDRPTTTRGESSPASEGPVQVASAPTGLMDSVVNRSLRLFLNL